MIELEGQLLQDHQHPGFGEPFLKVSETLEWSTFLQAGAPSDQVLKLIEEAKSLVAAGGSGTTGSMCMQHPASNNFG